MRVRDEVDFVVSARSAGKASVALGGIGCSKRRETLTITVLVLSRGQQQDATTRDVSSRRPAVAYKKGEGLLELRDLLFGKGIGLLEKTTSASSCAGNGCSPTSSSAGLPPQHRKLGCN
jgi:hypothetical protein